MVSAVNSVLYIIINNNNNNIERLTFFAWG